jgi:hypothetical protein
MNLIEVIFCTPWGASRLEKNDEVKEDSKQLIHRVVLVHRCPSPLLYPTFVLRSKQADRITRMNSPFPHLSPRFVPHKSQVLTRQYLFCPFVFSLISGT